MQITPLDIRKHPFRKTFKGFDPDHENADLLRHKGIHLGSDEKLPDELFDGRAVAYCMERFRVLRPLVQWLDKNVA